MRQKKPIKSIKSIVRLPKQDRSRQTVEAILESAFQILEADGLDGFKVVRATGDQLAPGSFSAIVSPDYRSLVDGRWGSSMQDKSVYEGHWEASR